MASIYSPSSLGIKSPTGGFQQGGWYNGRQYWNGTLSDPGAIHPESNQQGAGKDVSNQVIAQTKPENVPYIEAQRRKAATSGVAPVGNVNPTGSLGVGGDGVATGMGGVGLQGAEASLNLPTLYKSLYDQSGISQAEQQYNDMKNEFVDAQNKINNNPFLSEATRVGRVAKLQNLFDQRTANIQSEIAQKKADVETKLNLELKQMDLNNAATQRAWDQFNTLLSSGMLAGASGNDIAAITRATGISSDMINSAIKAQNKKDVKTQVIQSTADNGTVTVSVINTETGEVIKQSNLGQIGNKQNTGGGATAVKQNAIKLIAGDMAANANEYGHVTPQVWSKLLENWVMGTGSSGLDFVQLFAQYRSPNEKYAQPYGEKIPTDTGVPGVDY